MQTSTASLTKGVKREAEDEFWTWNSLLAPELWGSSKEMLNLLLHLLISE